MVKSTCIPWCALSEALLILSRTVAVSFLSMACNIASVVELSRFQLIFTFLTLMLELILKISIVFVVQM